MLYLMADERPGFKCSSSDLCGSRSFFIMVMLIDMMLHPYWDD